MNHLDNHNILSPNQFGFRKKHSTYMPLLILQNRILDGFEQGKIGCTIYLDLKKAFDTVDHRILLHKLQLYGINGVFLAIIASYLSNRYQCVEYMNVKSGLQKITMGVPQGSILGPLLFLLYINDFPKISTKFESFLYADDTALFFKADSTNELQKMLDEELPKVHKWLQTNKLTLNIDKTVYQIYNKSKTEEHVQVNLAGSLIQQTNVVKYLGIMVEENMKWEAHVMHISRIISRNIGIINRSKHFLNKEYLQLLYNAMVLPYINYCCLLWGTSSKSALHRLTILQKKNNTNN